MSEREKEIVEKLAAACEQLPDGKKEFLMGYAEGVAAMAVARQAGGNPAAENKRSCGGKGQGD